MKCTGFSLEHYEDILSIANAKMGSVSEKKQIVLTHDIDLIPDAALKLARLEHKWGVKATYYILLHSETYNALSPENMEIWQEIKGLGHELALHYDGRYDQELMKIVEAFNSMLQVKTIDVSHHLKFLIPDIKVPVELRDRADLVREGYTYIADSGGWWRKGCVCQHLDEQLFFVCHPIWWCYPNSTFYHLEKLLEYKGWAAVNTWRERVDEHRKQQVQQ